MENPKQKIVVRSPATVDVNTNQLKLKCKSKWEILSDLLVADHEVSR